MEEKGLNGIGQKYDGYLWFPAVFKHTYSCQLQNISFIFSAKAIAHVQRHPFSYRVKSIICL